MRQRTSRITIARSRTSTEPLAEGIAKPNVQIVILAGKTFEIPMRGKLRNWSAMSDDEVVAYTKAYLAEKGITKSSQLQKGSNKDSGLNDRLQKRKLLSQIFERRDFEEVIVEGKTFQIPLNVQGDRNWSAMSDDEVVAYAKAHIAEKGITKPSQLRKGQNKDLGLRQAIQLRHLVDQIFERKQFDEVTLDGRTFKILLDNKQKRNWKAMTDDEIVEYAKAYCAEKGITKTSQLQKGPNKDSGLKDRLQKRKLMNKIFERKIVEEVILQGKTFTIPLDTQGRRNWVKMSDDDIVAYAKAYCAEKEITTSNQLQLGSNRFTGLWSTLARKNLLHLVFNSIKDARKIEALSDLASALETFGGKRE